MSKRGARTRNHASPPVRRRRRLDRIWAENRHVLKVWVVFLGVFGVFMALLNWSQAWFEPRANAFTAMLAAWTLRLLGEGGHHEGTLVLSSLPPLEIIWECTGITPISIYLAAVLAYPASWKAKGWGILSGVPALLVVNLIRVVSLAYVADRFPDAFEIAHVFVWQSLIIFVTVLLWLLWIITVVGHIEIAAR